MQHNINCSAPDIYVLLIVLIILASVASVTASNSDVYLEKIAGIIMKVEKLSSEGVDTRAIEIYLNNALRLLDKGGLTDVERSWVEGNLSLAERIADELINTLGRYVLWRNIRLGLTVGLIALIPILVYLFLPRVWAYLWFKTRRRWIVKLKK
ncbi:MAG: hypothetical protein QW836_09995 [Ignisphaera sp.]